jgi:hypothetical protein
MLCYTFLAAEFLLRIHYRNPFHREVETSPPGTPSDKPMRDEGYMPFRITLMVVGLGLATVFVFIRFVAYASRSPLFPD